MSGEPSQWPSRLPLQDADRVDQVFDPFEAAWRAGGRPRIEDYLDEGPPAIRSALLQELLAAELEWRLRRGEQPVPGEYLERFAEHSTVIGRVFDDLGFTHKSATDPLGSACDDSTATLPRRGRACEATGSGLPAIPGYEVLEELGRGGMGLVYKARELGLNRVVALKMILAGAHASPEARLRFKNEAEVVARLRHPNIVQVFGLGDHEGRPYVELEYIEGGNLARALDGTPRPAAAAAEFVEVLARAVQAAHSRGIIHRDLKPAKVLLTSDREPKIADFGLAKAVDYGSDLTGTNVILGSPSYMAPEQAGGEARSSGPAADVCALGAMFYELLTGRPPFKAASVLATLEQVRTTEPVAPSRLQPGLPRDAETICLKCLRKDPAHRYLSALELADDLRRWLDGEPVVARPVGATGRIWRWCRRKPIPAALAAAVAALSLNILFGAPVLILQLRLQRDESRSHLRKALEAERDAKKQNLQSNLEQARALRLSRQVGQRVQSLAALGRAARLLPTAAESEKSAEEGQHILALRSVAIQSLSLVDLIDESRPHSELPWYGLLISVDEAFERYAYADRQDVVVRALDNGRELLKIPHPARVHMGLNVKFSPDGRSLSVLYWIKTPSKKMICVVWNLDDRRPVLTVDVGANGMSFSPDNECLAFVEPDETIAIAEIATAVIRRRFPASNDKLLCFSFDPNGRCLAVAGSGEYVRIFDVDTGAIAGTLKYTGRINALAWRVDGRLLAAGGEERAAVWEVPEGRLVSVLLGHTGKVIAAVFRNTDGLLATSSWDDTTRLWDLVRGRELLSTSGGICRFSPDAERLIIRDGVRVVAWRVAGGLECRKLHHGNVGNQAPRTSAIQVRYSPDGRMLAAAGHDGVQIWDSTNARELAHLRIGPTQIVLFLPAPVD
jgi:WD40 repeat protein/predicted Ser/Thr protein kinase